MPAREVRAAAPARALTGTRGKSTKW
jgi:hypothetical protein